MTGLVVAPTLFEIVEHLVMYLALVVAGMFIAKALVNYITLRMQKKYTPDPEKTAKILDDAVLSLRMATSLNANATDIYKQMTGECLHDR